MADYLEKIREAFRELPTGRKLKLDASAWAFVDENDAFGVYLRSPSGEAFSRSFAGAELVRRVMSVDNGDSIPLLRPETPCVEF